MEPTLAVTKSFLESQLGTEAGYGSDPSLFDDEQARNVRNAILSGQRQFYYPPPTPGNPNSHAWSFLKVKGDCLLASGTYAAPLPPDFQSLESQVVLSDAGKVVCPIRVSADARVWRSERPDTTGRPQACELVWRAGTAADRGQRAALEFWPTADQDYHPTFLYTFNPDALVDERPFAYGGAAHAETMLASCLAAMEFYLFGARGNRWQFFLERLTASASIDRKLKPEVLGYLGDGSDGRRDWGRRPFGDWPPVTINGVPIT